MTQDSITQSLENYLTKPKLSRRWQDWVQVNLQAGCDKNGMFKIMLDEGFDYDLIKNILKFEPVIPLDQIINPLKPAPDTPPVVDPERMTDPFIPNARRLEQEGIEFYILDDFLNAEECTQIIERIKANLRPSEITASNEPDKYFRTSSTCDMGLLDVSIIKETDRRICAIMGLDPAYSEVIQGQHYEIGQEFKAHTDYFEKDELDEFGGTLGQRSYTVMIYLNDVEEGGETEFPLIQQTVMPKLGRAVIWNSLHPDGTVNANSLHHARPVKRGHKTVITKWFRTRDGLPVFLREENENLPNYTQTGIRKDILPKALFDKIQAFYRANLHDEVEETVPGDFIENTLEPTSGSSLVELSQSLRDDIHSCLKDSLEAWSGVELQSTYVYGIRIYKNGAVLKAHRDRMATHIVSAIINVDQDVNKDWPLVIEDNYYRRHDVILKPGEIVYYEGARLAHGRPIPLDGTSYANIFCHFKPVSG